MRKTVVWLLAICLSSAGAASGCSRAKAESVEPASASPSPAPSPAPSPSPTASPSPQPAGPSPVDAIDFEGLVALLPDVTGWTRNTPTGQQIKTTMSYARANADYSRGESLIRLELTDSGFNNLLLAPLSMMLVPSYSERSTDGYRRYAAVAGEPGFESWQDDAKDGEVTVVVARRFVVNARGTLVPNIEAVRAVVQQIDLAKLAALK
jgi:hypothetical protein